MWRCHLAALYITSSAKGSGKTTIGAGLAQYWLGHGKKAGFLKLVIADSPDQPLEMVNSEAMLMKKLLALAEPLDRLCPVFRDESHLQSGLREAYTKVAAGKEVVIIEGVSDHSPAQRQIAELLEAKVIVATAYSPELPQAVNSYRDFGRQLLGIVVNKVPRRRREQVLSEISAQLAPAAVNLLGVLPEDRTLFTLTVGELAECLQGKVLSDAEKSVELVESVMLGANCVDPGPEYFGRQEHKAVILRSERPDMQLAALATPARCLVLSGGTPPTPVVRYQAEDKSVPIIAVGEDITTIARRLEEALGKARFSLEKLPRLSEMMAEHFDFPAVSRGLGLAS